MEYLLHTIVWGSKRILPNICSHTPCISLSNVDGFREGFLEGCFRRWGKFLVSHWSRRVEFLRCCPSLPSLSCASPPDSVSSTSDITVRAGRKPPTAFRFTLLLDIRGTIALVAELLWPRCTVSVARLSPPASTLLVPLVLSANSSAKARRLIEAYKSPS